MPPAALLKMLLVLEATRMELSVRVIAVWVLGSAANSRAVMGVLLVEKAGLLQQCPSLRHVPVPAPGHIPMHARWGHMAASRLPMPDALPCTLPSSSTWGET